MWFATYLYRNGLVSAEQVLDAAERQANERVPIGRLALEQKLLTVKQVAQVLSLQANERKPFGRIAVEHGLLSEADVAYLLMVQIDRTKPIDEYLVEMGAIDPQTMREEFAKARQVVHDEKERSAVLARAL